MINAFFLNEYVANIGKSKRVFHVRFNKYGEQLISLTGALKNIKCVLHIRCNKFILELV